MTKNSLSNQLEHGLPIKPPDILRQSKYNQTNLFNQLKLTK